MKCLVINTGVVGLLAALMMQKQYTNAISIQLLDTDVEQDAAIRLGPETLNFIVRDLGVPLPELMQGKIPGIFYLGMQIQPHLGSTSTVSHRPTRAQVGGLPVNYAVDRVRWVGGREKLESYSLAARMISANAMALPNKNGECPLGDDEIGICISLAHLRSALIDRLTFYGINILRIKSFTIASSEHGVRLELPGNNTANFDYVITSVACIEGTAVVRWRQTRIWEDSQVLSKPCANLTFDGYGWANQTALAAQKCTQACRIGWNDDENFVNVQSSWFSCRWSERAVYLSEYDYWGADFMLDPLQPTVRAVQLLTQLLPVNSSAGLLAQYFNERTTALAQSVREFVVAILMESGLIDGESLLTAEDVALYHERKNIYLTTGEAKQSSAALINDGLWAAMWHSFSVPPKSISSLLRPIGLEDVARQLGDIDKNIADMIPRLPRHHYYISLINGGAA